MGIKGIYRELGPGQRVSLSKLAADSFDASSRPLRLAIDIAIWQFQTQAARGGTNPAIRTLFYRLVRLLATPIEPIFVFDGPHKPVFKRNKRSGRGDGVATAQAKRLIRLFGFAVHDAPGEAEAECALLQKHGIVDAVLSEDVDTIMFGCTKTLRNWSAETKSSKTPTHVSVYDVNDLSIVDLGLDREGMVLVALMSGGDYLPDGIPGCGVKVACEAAKAGFGRSICRLKTSDKAGVRAWREGLIHELRTNEKGYFRTKHKALVVPEDFPNLEVLGYYTHPVVSPASNLDAIRQNMDKKRNMHLEALREFTRETFDWDFRIGAIKFIRVLGQALLVQKIRQGGADSEGYVKRISGRRKHFSTDATPELRLAYIPQETVPIDLSKEVDENLTYGRDGLALNSDDEFDAPAEGVEAAEGTKPETGKTFDVTKPDLAWVLEGIARKSVPKAIQAWEDAEQAKTTRKVPKKKASATKSKKESKKAADMPQGALDGYVRVTKSVRAEADAPSQVTKAPSSSQPKIKIPAWPETLPQSPPHPRKPSKQSTSSTAPSQATLPHAWTIDSSPVTPRPCRRVGDAETIVIASSPPATACSPPPSPSPRPHDAVSGAEKLPSTIRAILSASNVSSKVSSSTRETAKSAPKSNTASPAKANKWKQTSLDMFTKKSLPSVVPPVAIPEPPLQNPVAPQQETVAEDSQDSDSSDLETLSSLLSQLPSSPGKRSSKTTTSSRGANAGPSRKKKVLVPGASADGFFDEIEVDVEERDAVVARHAKLLSSRGVKTAVTRWSDVSVIDLTED